VPEPAPATSPINLLDPSYTDDPYPALAALREGPGVARDAFGLVWFVTRHDDVDRLVHDRSLSSDPRNGDPGTLDAVMEARNSMGADERQVSMLFLDPPDHTRLRGLVNKAFTPRAIEAMRPRAAELANELLDRVAGRESFDFMEAFAAPYPTTVIAELIGVDTAARATFKEWSDLIVLGLHPMLPPDVQAKVEEANQALAAYFEQVLAERRANQRDDLISRLLAASEDEDRLSEAEVVSTLILLLVAGNVTTTDLIGNGLLALLENPDQLELLRREPGRMAHAVEEMLRFDSPVIQTGRTPLTGIEVGGCPIGARQSIAPSLGAANRDPRVYPDADRFDITRDDVHHHSFGGGAHYCLGAPLARMEAQEAFRAVLSRFPVLRLPEGYRPVRRTLPGFRGLQSLTVISR
jgi:cytochrome P450